MWKRLSGYEWATLACAVGTLLVAILAWVEQSRWLPALLPVIAAIPLGPLFMMLVALGFLLILRKMHRLDENRKADRSDIGTKLSELETRTNENLNKSQMALRNLIEPQLDNLDRRAVRMDVRLGLHETRLENIDESLLDRIAADFAPDRRRFAFAQIEALGPINQTRLFEKYPDVLKWYAEVESAAEPEGIPRSEVIYREPDGRAWTFGEIYDRSSDELDALRDENPQVWRAYRGRLFRGVVFPDEAARKERSRGI